MTAFRTMALTLALGLLAACDDAPRPPAPVPAPPRTEPAPAPKAASEVPSAAAPATPEPEPVTRAAPPDKAPAAARQLPRRAEGDTAKSAARSPQAKLDLHLPDELLQNMELGEPVELPEQEPLLPPLFGEKPAEPGPYQLNGRLITNDRSDDYWESVEGAELQIEFRN